MVDILGGLMVTFMTLLLLLDPFETANLYAFKASESVKDDSDSVVPPSKDKGDPP